VTGGRCGEGTEITLRDALAVSCNTVFAELAVELGGTAISSVAQRAGFNSVLDFELGAAISSLPTAAALDADPGALAQTGLGERDVRVTPLQMAVIAAALGNEGVVMQPHIVDRVISLDGTTLDTTSPRSLGQWVDPDVAADVLSMMGDVVTTGTGRAGAVAGTAVAGKTGTAEGAGGPHSWFIAVAPADAPTIAVAVVIEGEGTGGTTAAPVASQVISAWLASTPQNAAATR
jgi:peptidoglycan glycosyltransferase